MGTNARHTNRRTLLKTVAGSGALPLVAPAASAGGDDATDAGGDDATDAGGDDEYTTITTGMYRGEPTSTEEVPTAWYEKVRASRAAMGVLADEYFGKGGVFSVGRTSADRTIAGFRIPELELRVEDADVIPDGVPLEIDDVPVTVVEGIAPRPLSCGDDEPCETDPYGPFDRVPGGAAVSAETPGDLRGGQSGGIAVETFWGAQRYITAAHGFADESCDDDIVGLGLEQGGREIGKVRQYDWNADWAVVDFRGGTGIDGFADEIVPHSVPVTGHVTEDGIDYLKDHERTVYRYGRTTCEEEGLIESDNLYLHCSDSEETGKTRRFIRTSLASKPGDSGGPHYRFVGDEDRRIEIIGIHTGCGRGAWASAAYDIHERWGFEFGGRTHSET